MPTPTAGALLAAALWGAAQRPGSVPLRCAGVCDRCGSERGIGFRRGIPQLPPGGAAGGKGDKRAGAAAMRQQRRRRYRHLCGCRRQGLRSRKGDVNCLASGKGALRLKPMLLATALFIPFAPPEGDAKAAGATARQHDVARACAMGLRQLQSVGPRPQRCCGRIDYCSRN